MEKDQEVSLYRAVHHAIHKNGLHKLFKLKDGSRVSPEDIKKAQGSSNPHVKLLGHAMEVHQASMKANPQGATNAMEKDLGYKE